MGSDIIYIQFTLLYSTSREGSYLPIVSIDKVLYSLEVEFLLNSMDKSMNLSVDSRQQHD